MTTTLDKIRTFWPQVPLKGDSPREIPSVGRDDLAQLFANLNFTRGVEIGTQRGLYAEVLCAVNPGLYLDCVDPYRAYKGYREHKSQKHIDAFYMEATHRLRNYRVTFVRDFSIDASLRYDDESLDFAYIDGNHRLLSVIEDLHYWVPKVRKGGIVSGHDFIRRDHSGYAMHVVQALHAYTQSYGIDPWFVIGSKTVREGEVRDKPRSWMFIRE